MDGQTPSDLRLNGVGEAAGGTYRQVTINGVGTVRGALQCARLRTQGVVKILGSVQADATQIHGVTSIQGDLVGGRVTLGGSLHIAAGCAADRVVGRGSLVIGGLLNAEEIRVTLQYGASQVGEIGAARIRITRAARRPDRAGRHPAEALSVHTVEGDDVYLEHTTAQVVRGNTVVIGPGCAIACVEYRSSLRQHPDAVIGREQRQA
jgi:cytoskeletal protein CcmA (bactofilin family)